MAGDVDVKNTPPIMANDEEDIKHVEGEKLERHVGNWTAG
jgi:hypothetical protein